MEIGVVYLKIFLLNIDFCSLPVKLLNDSIHFNAMQCSIFLSIFDSLWQQHIYLLPIYLLPPFCAWEIEDE